MAFTRSREESVKELVAALLAEECRAIPGETIDDIENLMCQIGDMVAREVAAVKLAGHTSETAAPAACPRCGRESGPVGRRARRVLTRRGEVEAKEAKHRCPKCRRNFFPSDEPAGS